MSTDATTLKRIAILAHAGGLAGPAGLTESETLIAIRRLTLPHWDRSANLDQMAHDAADALSEANLCGATWKATTPP